jgi:hypothetical protein
MKTPDAALCQMLERRIKDGKFTRLRLRKSNGDDSVLGIVIAAKIRTVRAKRVLARSPEGGRKARSRTRLDNPKEKSYSPR